MDAVILLLTLLYVAHSIPPPNSPDTSALFMDMHISQMMWFLDKSPVTVDARYNEDQFRYRTGTELRPVSFNCTGCDNIEACLAAGSPDECVAAAPSSAVISEYAWLIIPSQNTCGEAAIREAVFGFELTSPELVDYTVYAQDLYLDLISLSPHCAGLFFQLRPLREDAARMACMTIGNDGKLMKIRRHTTDMTLIVRLEEDIPIGLYNRRWIFTAVDARFLPPADDTSVMSAVESRARRLDEDADEKLEKLLNMTPLFVTVPTDGGSTSAGSDVDPIDGPVGPFNNRDSGDKYAQRWYWSQVSEPECFMQGQFWNNIVIGVKRDRFGTATSQG